MKKQLYFLIVFFEGFVGLAGGEDDLAAGAADAAFAFAFAFPFTPEVDAFDWA
jgi:hypothetical protein